MTRTKKYLNSITDRYRPNFSLSTALWDNRVLLFIFYKLRLLLIRTLSRSFFHFLQYYYIAVVFPLFNWSALFFVQQMLFIYEGFSWGSLEPLRREIREIPLRNRSVIERAAAKTSTYIFAQALLPIIIYACWLVSHLSKHGRYFGIYDALIGVMIFKSSMGIVFQYIQACIAAKRRLAYPIKIWLVPTVTLFFSILIFFEFFGNWGIPYAFALEAVVQLYFQWSRLNLGQRFIYQASIIPNLIRMKPKKTNLNQIPSMLYFGFVSIGLRTENIILAFYFLHFGSNALLIQGLSPLLKIFSQWPFLFWLELSQRHTAFYRFAVARIESAIYPFFFILSAVTVALYEVITHRENALLIQVVSLASVTLCASMISYLILKRAFYPEKKVFFLDRVPEPIDRNQKYFIIYFHRSFWTHTGRNKIIDRFFSTYPRAVLLSHKLIIPYDALREVKMKLSFIRILKGFLDTVSTITGEEIVSSLLYHYQKPIYKFNLKNLRWSPNNPSADLGLSTDEKHDIITRTLSTPVSAGKLQMPSRKIRFFKASEAELQFIISPSRSEK
jgi:hypothetical protein